LKTIIVNAPAELRETLNPLTDKALVDRCAGFRPGSIDSPTVTDLPAPDSASGALHRSEAA